VFAGAGLSTNERGAKVRGNALDLGADLADSDAVSEQDGGDFLVWDGIERKVMML
jgi:hypothetical protein